MSMNDVASNDEAASGPRRHNGPISRRLLAIARTVRSEEPSVGELFDRLESEGLGLTLLLLTLPALIPLPGPFGMVFGTFVALVALQILFGAERLWLPQTIRQRPVPQRLLRKVIRAGLDWAGYAERGLREDRLAWLTGRTARMLLALPLLLMAVTIILPIPMGNVMPALALIAASIGFMAADGLAVLVSMLIAMAAVVWTAVLLYTGAAAADYAAMLLARLAVHLRAMLESVGVDLGFAAGVSTVFAVAAGLAALAFWIQAVRHRRSRRTSLDAVPDARERSRAVARRNRGLLTAASLATAAAAIFLATRFMLTGWI
ncbi:exopolysaccharide biosynthesis protein [Bradyrhizobium sp. 83002]|uniref:exopolysaccharide biosynthesis protein n=1 Tax=Bradyrhizobium aeschynomenes TaxID=2734909 RepID=UPI001553B7FD|nr:exopolysaccharide biosynthesis protein [Bradyrhizobium aeschynomenes]NPU10411.1 exopolysaccharide biosynthesis protein [Bradyrhizobium aeschynomenes]NPV19727.1 exopolysaccharide biosynthesis protein [Bradyrhizobium aeschynomenes]